MSKQTSFEEFRKAQQIVAEAIDKSARSQLASVEKLLEINRQSFEKMGEVSSPADFFSRQSTALKEYAEQVNHQFEELAAIGNESREQLTELGQDFARNLDMSSLFNFEPAAAKPRKSTSKAA